MKRTITYKLTLGHSQPELCTLYLNQENNQLIIYSERGSKIPLYGKEFYSQFTADEYWQKIGREKITTHYVDLNNKVCLETITTKHPCTCNSHILFLRGCQCGGI